MLLNIIFACNTVRYSFEIATYRGVWGWGSVMTQIAGKETIFCSNYFLFYFGSGIKLCVRGTAGPHGPIALLSDGRRINMEH